MEHLNPALLEYFDLIVKSECVLPSRLCPEEYLPKRGADSLMEVPYVICCFSFVTFNCLSFKFCYFDYIMSWCTPLLLILFGQEFMPGEFNGQKCLAATVHVVTKQTVGYD